MYRPSASLWLPLLAIYSFWLSLAHAVSGDDSKSPSEGRGYNLGEPIPVSCLNRTVETGEHVRGIHAL